MLVHLQVKPPDDDRTQKQGLVLMQAIVDQMTITRDEHHVYGGKYFECDGDRGIRYSGPTGVFFHTDKYYDDASLNPLEADLTNLEKNHGHKPLHEFCPAYDAPENTVGGGELGGTLGHRLLRRVRE